MAGTVKCRCSGRTFLFVLFEKSILQSIVLPMITINRKTL
jgi:hypothetical protein